MPSSSDALTELKSGPLYFFDQPTRRRRIKRTHLEDKSNQENVSKGEDHELTERLTGEACGGGTPDTSPAAGAALTIKDHGRMDAYRRAAPQLLNELAGLLSQNKRTEARSVPHGIANILSYSWEDLTAGVMPLKGPEPTYKRPEFDDAGGLVPGSDDKDAEQSVPRVGNRERTPDVSLDAGVKRRKHNSKIAAHSTTTSFSVLSFSCKSSGWIMRPEQLCHDEPEQIALCQWVVERLQAARNPERLGAAEPSQDAPPVLRHYGSAQTRPTDRRAKPRALPVTLVNGVPEIPDLRQQSPAQQKLHYRINDGSSFIYYPSGRMAVCQSHSGLPSGGFYTNVFSDSQCPAFLATITASGHGAVTRPLSTSVTALWDQDGGFMCDQLGNITEEWRWKTEHRLRGKIVIQVSHLISVRLFSGTSALLSFRCNDESVHLPLCGLSHISRPKETTDAKFTCSDATRPLLVRKTESPAGSPEHKRNLTLAPASQMVGEVEGQEEPSAPWRRGGRGVRELRRLQQRARGALGDWLACYRQAVGIECPGVKRAPDAPAGTGPRGEGRSAALPSLNPPERADAKPERGGKGLHRRPTVPAGGAADTSTTAPRTKKRGKEGPCVTRIGPLQIHGNIQLESVIIPMSLESQPSTVSRCPAPLPFPPSVPLTVCPVLLRAALLGEGGGRRCCCSSTRMPAVTDLEYDAFVTGQPPHSKQILVVCVSTREQDPLEQLYGRRNKHRAMPCTQCQMDSFRLVRYETAAAEPSCRVQNVLLQQRHNAAPGMVLMYTRGKLLFVGYIFSDHRGSVINLQKQISSARAGYRSGVSLPADHKFSDAVDFHTDTRPSRDAALAGRNDMKRFATVEKQKAGGRSVAK